MKVKVLKLSNNQTDFFRMLLYIWLYVVYARMREGQAMMCVLLGMIWCAEGQSWMYNILWVWCETEKVCYEKCCLAEAERVYSASV